MQKTRTNNIRVVAILLQGSGGKLKTKEINAVCNVKSLPRERLWGKVLPEHASSGLPGKTVSPPWVQGKAAHTLQVNRASLQRHTSLHQPFSCLMGITCRTPNTA